MSEQIQIDFERTHTRAGGPATSRQAARKISSAAASQCDEIVAVLSTQGPRTAYEIAEHIPHMEPHAVGKRLSDLLAKDDRPARARRNGEKRRNMHGNLCAVWEVI